MQNNKVKGTFHFFDKLEDKIRAKLSRFPILYAFFGGVGVVLFWRGVWHSADDYGLHPLLSIILGSLILLIIGAFVTTFIGNRLIVTGLYGEKKLAEKTKEEIDTEKSQITKIQNTLNKMEEQIVKIGSEIEKN